MNKKLTIIIGFLAICVVLISIIVPVSAGSTTNTTAITGNPTSYASLSANLTSIYLPLTPGVSATNSSLALNVTSNEAFTIYVTDNTNRIAPGIGVLGYMGNYTSTNGYNQGSSALNTTLATPIQMTGSTNGTTTGYNVGTVSAPINTTARTLYYGSQPVNQQWLFNTFTQPVTYYDPILPTANGGTYRIDILFTLSYT